jgi:predicted membrane chloride channel (bestrophin family)
MQRPDPNYVLNRDYPGQGAPVRQVMWDDDNHWRFLTKLYGSVWPGVFPFCIANSLLCLIIFELKAYEIADLTVGPSGHTIAGMLMSFLVVVRVSKSYEHYMEASKLLSDSYRTCRELVQFVCLLTASDMSDRAKEWRQDVAYSTILMLRVTTAVLEMQSKPEIDPWDVPELSEELQKHLKHVSLWHQNMPENAAGAGNAEPQAKNTTAGSTTDPLEEESIRGAGNAEPQAKNTTAGSTTDPLEEESIRGFAHSDLKHRHRLEEAFRAPTALAFSLRREILKQRDGTWLTNGAFEELDFDEEIAMLEMVDEFLKAFHGLARLVSTKFPFPLVQMNKTFLLVWTFTLPCALCHDDFNQPFLVMFLVFLTTFGFLGLEFVSMDLADMFGDDPCDFDNLGYAQLCFEDIYISVYKQDGPLWARALRERVMGRKVTTKTLRLFREQSDRCLNPHVLLSMSELKTETEFDTLLGR